VKKLIYALLTSSILFTIGCEDEKKEESVEAESIIGTWTLSAVCMFADENCSGECSDMTAEFLEIEGSYSLNFLEGGTGSFQTDNGSDSFNWSGSGPYTISLEGLSITVTLSDGSATFNLIENSCSQFTFIK
jgi:hypothetical protein